MTQAAALAAYGSNSPSNRNRIINGDMRIDQRNAGASYTQVNGVYSLDRWSGNSFDGGAASNKYSVQQSTTAPAGFSNSLLVTSLAATADSGNDIFNIEQKIEGFNSADLAFGTASAKTITLSFWVRSSLTGTFGGAIKNSARDRAYPFAYTISSANTFEYKTITIAGDTSGTWVGSTNGMGLWLSFGLGVSSSRSDTAGAWAGGDLFSSTGAVRVIGTSGATFYITGVQLEEGSVATPFEHRMYGTELQLCQRYFEIIKKQDSGLETLIGIGFVYSNPNTFLNYRFKATKRAQPTLTLVGTATSFQVLNTSGSWLPGTAVTTMTSNQESSRINIQTSFSGLTTGQAAEARCDNGGGQVWIYSEL